MPIASYLVEDSVGNDSLTSRVVNGIRFYQAQDLSISAAQRKKNLAIMDMQPGITAFESQFNGSFPFASDGIIIGTPDASFDEEMEGMIAFAGGDRREACPERIGVPGHPAVIGLVSPRPRLIGAGDHSHWSGDEDAAAIAGAVVASGHASRLVLALFLGVTMCVSAIPVIAKTLSDLGLLHRNLGQLILASGSIDDAVGWLLLSVVSAAATTGVRAGTGRSA
jgi:hypothetical protein